MIPQILCSHCYPGVADDRLNPRKIPAKVVLAGLGEMDLTISRPDHFGGCSTRILPDDPGRKMFFVPAPGGNAAQNAWNQSHGGQVPCRVAYGCVLGTIFGSVMFTAGVFSGNVLAIGVGLSIVMTASFVLMDRRLPQVVMQLNSTP